MTTIGLNHDCPRCGTRHLTSCCHASRHNLCDLCVHEQHEQRARAIAADGYGEPTAEEREQLIPDLLREARRHVVIPPAERTES